MNSQYNKPPRQMPPNIPPREPHAAPADDKKRRRDAVYALGDKISAAMMIHPVLDVIGGKADVISYIVTGVSALLTVLSMALDCVDVVFGYVSLIFGFFALVKKSALPLSAALSVLSFFKLVCFINSIANFAVLDRHAVFSAGFVLSFVFSILELAAIGYLTFLAWPYALASLPEGMRRAFQGAVRKRENKEPKNAQETESGQEPISEGGSDNDGNGAEPAAAADNAEGAADASEEEPPAAHKQPAINVSVAAPVLKPLVSAYNAAPDKPVTARQKKFCTDCGTENTVEAVFCKQCGHKFQAG